MTKIAIQELQIADSVHLVEDLSVEEMKALKGGWGEYECEGYKKKEEEKEDDEKKKYYPCAPCYYPYKW
jgi:hypothetical protein